MAKLVLSLQGRMLTEFELNKEHITIGRKPDNDIQIENLAVSSYHAVVHNLFNQALLEDLESTNGTFINGERITKRALKEGDIILLGKHELKYRGGAGAAEEDFDRTIVIRPPAGGISSASPTQTASVHQPHATQIIPPAAVNESTALLAKVAILSGPDKGKEFAFNKPVTTFGKKGFQVAAISKSHDGYYISHVEGSNTPMVNNAPIGSRSVQLREYDVLEVAGVKMTFLLG